jgi:hypothetical protein
MTTGSRRATKGDVYMRIKPPKHCTRIRKASTPACPRAHGKATTDPGHAQSWVMGCQPEKTRPVCNYIPCEPQSTYGCRERTWMMDGPDRSRDGVWMRGGGFVDDDSEAKVHKTDGDGTMCREDTTSLPENKGMIKRRRGV